MDPHEQRKKYFSILNSAVSNIKKTTKDNIKDNFTLGKKKEEIFKISSEMILYNNPSKN